MKDLTSPCTDVTTVPVLAPSPNTNFETGSGDQRCYECGDFDKRYESTPYLNNANCGLCTQSIRPPRCVPINYVERVCPIIPETIYRPSPYKMDTATTYERTYGLHKPLEKTESFRPPITYARNAGIIEGPSEYSYSYVPFKVPPYQKPPWAKEEEFKPVEGVVSGVTTYKSSFQKQCGRPAKIVRPKPYVDPNPGPMTDQTSYRQHFVAHDHQRVCPILPALHVVGTSTQPFHGITMYTASYQPPCVRRKTPSSKIGDHIRPRDFPLETESTYGAHYRPFSFQHCTPSNKKTCVGFSHLNL